MSSSFFTRGISRLSQGRWEGRQSTSKVLIALLAATVAIFTLAALFDTFVGDETVFKAIRLEDESQQRFFARFDIDPISSVTIVLVIAAGCLALRKVWESALTFLILPGQAFLILLPKAAIDRPRPPGELAGSFDSFPSGTATTSMMALGLVMYLVWMYVPQRPLRLGLQALLAATILTMGLFRVLAGEHWPSDLVGGYIAGGLWLVLIFWLNQKLGHRRTGMKTSRE